MRRLSIREIHHSRFTLHYIISFCILLFIFLFSFFPPFFLSFFFRFESYYNRFVPKYSYDLTFLYIKSQFLVKSYDIQNENHIFLRIEKKLLVIRIVIYKPCYDIIVKFVFLNLLRSKNNVINSDTIVYCFGSVGYCF